MSRLLGRRLYRALQACRPRRLIERFDRWRWRVRIGWQAYRHAGELYGKGLVTGLEFEGTGSRLTGTFRCDRVSADLIDSHGVVKKPVVFP